LLTKELQYVGSWRFANVFERVIEMVTSGRIDPRPLITKIMPFDQLGDAIVQAGSGENVLKMQIANPA
jgi:L-idonate 5-dehydrogenase